MIILPRIPQGGRYAQMKADLKALAEATQSQTLLPGVGTQIVQQTPAGTIVKAAPAEESPASSGEPIWL